MAHRKYQLPVTATRPVHELISSLNLRSITKLSHNEIKIFSKLSENDLKQLACARGAKIHYLTFLHRILLIDICYDDEAFYAQLKKFLRLTYVNIPPKYINEITTDITNALLENDNEPFVYQLVNIAKEEGVLSLLTNADAIANCLNTEDKRLSEHLNDRYIRLGILPMTDGEQNTPSCSSSSSKNEMPILKARRKLYSSEEKIIVSPQSMFKTHKRHAEVELGPDVQKAQCSSSRQADNGFRPIF